LTGVPDYTWLYGCFGTASGNLMGYWDRHGFPNFYTGPTANGIAPLNNYAGNVGIRSLWASRAGMDGRATDQYGHIDDYWAFYDPRTGASYDSTLPDPYLLIAERPEHSPDCIGDFIGLSQRKWTNLNNECDGNIDGSAFVYWDSTGNRRHNFVPGSDAGVPARDVQSGLREWTQWRGYDADVFTQLADINPNVAVGQGFTFTNLKAEIDSGYPVLLFLQPTNQFHRIKGTGDNVMSNANPTTVCMLAYGYYISDDGIQYARLRDSRATPEVFNEWTSGNWQASDPPLRGVIAYHPKPKITSFVRTNSSLTLAWQGPAPELYSSVAGLRTGLHHYVIERTPSLDQPFTQIGAITTNRSMTLTDCCNDSGFFRIRMLTP